jgi:hypothetical protein
MAAYWSGSAAAFLEASLDGILGEIARHQIHHYAATPTEQTPAWRDSIVALKRALGGMAAAARDFWVLLEFPMLRLGRRIDCVLLCDRAIFVLEFKRDQADAAALAQVEDYALDLFDFHEGSRSHPVVPLLVTGGVAGRRTEQLPLPGVWQPVQTAPEFLAETLLGLLRVIGAPARALDVAAWLRGAYRPVPTIIEAACMAYTRNGVAEIAEALADKPNLNQTTQALWREIAAAQAAGGKIILFVTGVPGAGKTLCGLNAAFSGQRENARGTFLTGNPTLVHVLRAALVNDARERGENRLGARRRMETVIQALPDFRSHYLAHADETTAERVIVIDEAQRCWSRDYAIRKTRDKPIQLSDSEPGHLLDIIGRHSGFAAIICLVGSGQEIHDGEGGLAEWGRALRARPEWGVCAPPDAIGAADTRWQLGPVPGLRCVPVLHLDVPVRQVRSTVASRWVDCVLQGDDAGARRLADAEAAGVPFFLTRDLGALRNGLRALARGNRRAGLLAGSGGARLRPEGLGAELPHMDAGAVAHWFLSRFPDDVRASDALEQVATEFSCQGLELDYAGVCWDLDLRRTHHAQAWAVRNFAGTKWQAVHKPEAIANQINTYRVLLTRARYATLIFVPRGDAMDATRPPAEYDAVAAFLLRCGARPWTAALAAPAPPGPAANPQAVLDLALA